MEILIVAGEASGDQHGANLVSALARIDPSMHFFGMGGPKLAETGVEIIHPASRISVMGIVEVLPKIPEILRVMEDLTREVRKRRPRCAILIDVPDFNLRLAQKLKRLKIPVIYYVSPMVWAWRQSRTRILAERVDRLLCIFPFEEAFLRSRGVNATYVGSPTVDHLPNVAAPEVFRQQLQLDVNAPTLAVLPGSRRSEISRTLPILIDACERIQIDLPNLQVLIPIAPGIDRSALAAAFAQSTVKPVFIDGRAPEVVGACDVAIVTSGTATLEAGLMQRPLVAVYKLHPLSYWLGRLLVRIPFFSLVNIVGEKEIIPELLQGNFTPERVRSEVNRLWAGPARDACLLGLSEVRRKMGERGASARAAQEIATFLKTAG